jgi:hypothetical protein
MAHGQIKLRIFPDGRVEAEVDGIRGNGCMKFIPLGLVDVHFNRMTVAAREMRAV